MKQDIENIIKKNLPEPAKGIEKVIENTEQDRIYNLLNENMIIGFNQALSQIDTSLIADEVLKVVVEKIKEIKIKDGFSEISGSYNSACDKILLVLNK